ncbi:MAG: DUF4190 domain-containing protein [Pirellulaceae bacterium]
MNQVVEENQYSSPSFSDSSSGPSDGMPYRAVSKAAIAGVVFSVMGLLSFWAPIFVLVSALAIGFGLIGALNVRRYPEELVGAGVAKVGMLLGFVSLVGAISWHSYVYATEVPEGYTRMAFYQLKPSKDSRTQFTKLAEELDGKQVFIKGYVRPGDKKTNLSKFVLTGDFGDCCFGGNPKINEVIGVDIHSEQTVDYSLRLRRILGTFHLNRNPKASDEKDVPQILYEIHATEIR